MLKFLRALTDEEIQLIVKVNDLIESDKNFFKALRYMTATDFFEQAKTESRMRMWQKFAKRHLSKKRLIK